MAKEGGNIEEIIPLLREFVERNSHIKDLQFDPNVPPRLLFDPYSKDYEDRKRIAHYFLLVASIDEGNVVGRAEYARRLMVYLHRKLGDDLFRVNKLDYFQKEVTNCGFYGDLGPLKEEIPKILVSANNFVTNICDGDLIEYARKLRKPIEMVMEISRFVRRMGGPIRKKAWIYMRWMVRPYPDLRIFDNFSPRDLYVPLTRDILRVGVCLNIISSVSELISWNHVEKVTEFARVLFPEDPVKVDYPFFLIGRWLRGKELTLQTLKNTLKLFDDFYRKTGYSILVTKEKTGYSAECPALPGCITQGETEEEVLKNMEEAIAAYLEVINKGF